MKKQYAFLLMGHHYDPAVHRCDFETARDRVLIRTVRSLDEAKTVAVQLQRDGVGAIELCGAFGPEGAEELTRLTGEGLAIGYVVHDPKLDSLFAGFFGKEPEKP